MSAAPVRLAEVSLDDRYRLDRGRAFMSGVQALVRLALEQRRRDAAAGHDTAGYVSGYRGSPLGTFDQQLRAAGRLLPEHRIHFQPGVNEDLAATACWGTQQAGLDGEGNCDGVFAIWYGKGPGVDRSGDALRHGNLAGSAALGGVLCLLGDDHTCESSTTAHQSEYAMVDAMIPTLNPAGVQEILDYGLHGIAMSRYSGCWVALKCVHDTVESSASVELDPGRVTPLLPEDFVKPPDGLNIRWPDTPLAQEARLHGPKLDAARAYCRANRLDRASWRGAATRLGIVTTGKSHLDVCQALADLGVDEAAAAALGIAVYKVAMPFPLEPEGVSAFCAGLERVIVVEEKRGLIEGQLKEILFGTGVSPAVVGKRDEQGRWLLPSSGRLDSNQIAIVIGERVAQATGEHAGAAATRLAAGLERARARAAAERLEAPAMERTPYFCPGCPHSSSTRVPEGSRALAGIGCHYLAQFMDRDTARYTQMGGEGASWVGQAPFSRRPHMFQNMGDGTYFHSGLLAVRAAVAADTPITFKLLYNDAVAMTGGQAMDGPLTVPMMAAQVHAEGVRRVVVVSDEPHKYPAGTRWPPGTTVHHRDELDAVQRRLREVAGVTVLVYDQTCAAEKRRRRKRGRYPDPPRRLFIDQDVCEGCGDCGVQSNCVAIVPVETELGRKRAIDQSACNKDWSCLKGFCPSFVSVHGGALRRAETATDVAASDATMLPEPALPSLADGYSVVITGVGGSGVITVGNVLGMAAHLEGRGCSILDMTGLAQKGGAVVSHLRVAAAPGDISATRIATGSADLLLGCDLVVSAGRDTLRTLSVERSRAVLDSQPVMTGEFTRNADLEFPAARLRGAVEHACTPEGVHMVDAHRLAATLLGDSIAGNLLLTGHAYQLGLLPLTAAAIERAIELNGVAVAMNLAAFRLGRRLAHEPEAVLALARPSVAVAPPLDESLSALVERRAAMLVDYQDQATADRYRALVERVRSTERERVGGERVARAVARSHFRLLAVKDEYEVARLYTEGGFESRLRQTFDGEYRVHLHLAVPLLARRDPLTGIPRKREYGPWVWPLLRLLARWRGVRGSWLDPFRFNAERRAERRLLEEYESLVDELVGRLLPANHALVEELAALPEQVRGFGHVKLAAIDTMHARREELLVRLRGGADAQTRAA